MHLGRAPRHMGGRMASIVKGASAAELFRAKSSAYVLICAVALVTGCSAKSKDDDAKPAAIASSESAAVLVPAGPTLTLAGSGLVLTPSSDGKAEQIRFGSDEKGVIAAVSTVLGKSAQGTNGDCPSGPVQFATWSKGLTANFQDGKFVGWAGAVDLKTARGIGFGSSRAALVKAYHPTIEQTSLGTEFTVDGITGVLESASNDAAISDLWAGMSCVAR